MKLTMQMRRIAAYVATATVNIRTKIGLRSHIDTFVIATRIAKMNIYVSDTDESYDAAD